jgi:hypothetical protein
MHQGRAVGRADERVVANGAVRAVGVKP